MVRVSSSTVTKARHNKVRKATKGYRGKRSTTFRAGMQALMKAGENAYVGRKQKKRDFRRLWITRLSTALRNMGTKYSVEKNNWLHARMEIDRKNLSELAVNFPPVFENIVKAGQKAKKS